MFRNYLLTALRNFTGHKLYTLINVGGLAVGLTCAIFIILFARDELSYDKWIPDSSNLYRIELTFQRRRAGDRLANSCRARPACCESESNRCAPL